jgi:hypothetical protein
MLAPLVLRRRFPLAAAAFGWIAAAALAAAAPPAFAADTVEDGTLLAASPDLKDPNFSHTVILVLRHDENATLGVVINRPTSIEPT